MIECLLLYYYFNINTVLKTFVKSVKLMLTNCGYLKNNFVCKNIFKMKGKSFNSYTY